MRSPAGFAQVGFGAQGGGGNVPRGRLGPGDFTEGLRPYSAGHRKAALRLVEVVDRLAARAG